ncbi:MAG TPA: hypothetical protein VN579_07440 [Bryobacteraceae bacterium]|nr:hypothetical protein [Bryobacteraceae bacterium]
MLSFGNPDLLLKGDRVPVENVFGGRYTVKVNDIPRLLEIGHLEMVGKPGEEKLFCTFTSDHGYDRAVLDPRGSAPTPAVGHHVRFDVESFSGEDANPGMPVLPLIGYDRSSTNAYASRRNAAVGTAA